MRSSQARPSYHEFEKYQDNEDPFAILSISIRSDFTVEFKDAYKIAVPHVFERGGAKAPMTRGPNIPCARSSLRQSLS